MIFAVSLPVIFLSFHLTSGMQTEENKAANKIFLYENSFYENPEYSLYIVKSSENIIYHGLLISKNGNNDSFMKIKNKDIRISGKNSFFCTVDKKELLFRMKKEYPETIRSFSRLLERFSDEWKKEALENSIVLIIKIGIFLLFILSLTAFFSISQFPVVNFVFYATVSIAAVYFTVIYQRINIPVGILSKLPPEAELYWGYFLLLFLSVVFLMKKSVSAVRNRKK